ncbi:Protein SOB FIVE-LIKE 4 [Euphorbia peplus]|nr:Protein SOB FIVE-LIKE 4 [Euphorbia peplus]
MESSPVLGCREEWSGTESGWTTYICSPVHSVDSEDDGHSFLEWKSYKMGTYSNYICDDIESDDSMTSDASSGPSRVEFPCTSSERNLTVCPFKHQRTEYSSRKKAQKQIQQIENVRSRIKVAKQVSKAFQANSATSHANCGTKVRKFK